MRITTNMMTNNYLASLNGSLEKQSTLQQQIADGKAIHKPSDDPIKTIRSLRFNSNLAMNEQYTQNVNDSLSWMNTTDSAMSDLSSIMIHMKELAVSADGTKPADSLNTIASEIDGLIEQAISIGNTKIGDRYVFAGQMDKTEPFKRTTVTDPVTGKVQDVVVYNGDMNKISMQIKQGGINPANDSINLTGVDIFGPLKTIAGSTSPVLDVFNQLIALKEELAKPNPDVTYVSNTGLANIDKIHANQLQQQTQIGTRMSTYEMAKSMLQNNKTTITTDLAANEDLNIPAALIDFKTAENVYQSALAVGAKILPQSLVDFLR
jgi:flagellar hook-associated protein 3 FlgL